MEFTIYLANLFLILIKLQQNIFPLLPIVISVFPRKSFIYQYKATNFTCLVSWIRKDHASWTNAPSLSECSQPLTSLAHSWPNSWPLQFLVESKERLTYGTLPSHPLPLFGLATCEFDPTHSTHNVHGPFSPFCRYAWILHPKLKTQSSPKDKNEIPCNHSHLALYLLESSLRHNYVDWLRLGNQDRPKGRATSSALQCLRFPSSIMFQCEGVVIMNLTIITLSGGGIAYESWPLPFGLC